MNITHEILPPRSSADKVHRIKQTRERKIFTISRFEMRVIEIGPEWIRTNRWEFLRFGPSC